ncbi:MAG: BamA/TamA family outer membrane protein [Deltaproteobacteria bacterium]|nr:BamA/TamA family outer membrane protein [Deltaproteobacteria bacterium]
MTSRLLTIILLGSAATASSAMARPPVLYEIAARIGDDLKSLHGSVTFAVQAACRASVEIFLYPNVHRDESPFVDDVNRTWIYPSGFDAGWMEVDEVKIGNDVIPRERWRFPESKVLRKGTLLSVPVNDGVTKPRDSHYFGSNLRASQWLARASEMGSPTERRANPTSCAGATFGAGGESASPSGTRAISIKFRTRVPEKFGPFGRARGQTTLSGFWHPVLAENAQNPPPVADFKVALDVPRAVDVIVQGRRVQRNFEGLPFRGRNIIKAQTAQTRAVSLVLAKSFRETKTRVGTTTLTYLHREPVATPPGGDPLVDVPGMPEPYAPRIVRLAREALRFLLKQGVKPPTRELMLIEAPYQLEVAHAIPGAVLVSDRTFRVFPLDAFRRFHEQPIARGLFTSIFRSFIDAHRGNENPVDTRWLPDALGTFFADLFIVAKRKQIKNLAELLDVVKFVPAIDSLIYAQQIPMREMYFGAVYEAFPLREELERFYNDEPRGIYVYAKLVDWIGLSAFARAVKRYLQSTDESRPVFRAVVAASIAADAEMPNRLNAKTPRSKDATKEATSPLGDSAPLRRNDPPFDTWLKGPPRSNYRVAARESRRVADGYENVVKIVTDGETGYREPVDLLATTTAGERYAATFKDGAQTHEFRFKTKSPLAVVQIDPRGRTVESDLGKSVDPRFDNRDPTRWKWLLTGLGWGVDATTGRLEALGAVAFRKVYDLHNGFGVSARWVQDKRMSGAFAYARSFGRKVNDVRLVSAVSAALSVARLSSAFGTVATREGGTTARLDFGYGYDNIETDLTPTRGTSFGAATGIGLTGPDSGGLRVNSFSSVGVRQFLRLAPPLVLGLRASLGFSFSDILNGGQKALLNGEYRSLGGRTAMRGYVDGELLGNHAILFSAELGWMLTNALAWNFVHTSWVRGIQLALFADAGAVSTDMSLFTSLSPWFTDVGGGIRIFFDYLGAQPGVLSIDVGLPLNRRAVDVGRYPTVSIMFTYNGSFFGGG